MKEIEKIDEAIRKSAASLWIDDLPLSKEYVIKYRKNRINKIKMNIIKNTKMLTLKRGMLNGKVK